MLDVGCGRGEFLTLLAGEGIAARGVDSDAGMVAHCRALGLEVEQGDVNEHLAGLPDGSLGTIFSAQVIEHLPHEQLRRLLELSLRKLAPGGLFIAETVNPHRISSLKTFWVDLTHQHPIFPEVALAICAIAGFQSAYVFAPGFDSFERARFDSPGLRRGGNRAGRRDGRAHADVGAAAHARHALDAAAGARARRLAAPPPARLAAGRPVRRSRATRRTRDGEQLPLRSVADELDVDIERLVASHDEEDLIALLLPRVLRSYSARGAGPLLHLPPTAWVLGDLAPVQAALATRSVLLVPRMTADIPERRACCRRASRWSARDAWATRSSGWTEPRPPTGS